MLQCVAVYCSVLQCVAVCCSVLQCVAVCVMEWAAVLCSVLQCAALCCKCLQCAALCCSVPQCNAAPCKPRDAVRYSVCAAVRCSALQHVAVCYSVLYLRTPCARLRFSLTPQRQTHTQTQTRRRHDQLLPPPRLTLQKLFCQCAVPRRAGLSSNNVSRCVLQCVAERCSVLQCVAVCRRAL